MTEYFVIERSPCPECRGRGLKTVTVAAVMFQSEIVCMDCSGFGTLTREVPLLEALAALAGPGIPWAEWASKTADVLREAQ
jgi:hypothetical protein